LNVGYLARSFDLLNVRDLDLIAQARARCNRLVVGVFTDEFILESYGSSPFVPLAERLSLVSHIRGVDQVVAHPEWTDAGENPHLRSQRIDRVFTVSDDVAQPPVTEPACILVPRRESGSWVVRDALRRVHSSAVA